MTGDFDRSARLTDLHLCSMSAPICAEPPPRAAICQRWYDEVPRSGWWALAAAGLGWLFEVFDLYILALTTPVLITVFTLTRVQAGMLSSLSAAGAIVGGIFFGWVADRIGRVRTLLVAVVLYSVFSGAVVFATSFDQLSSLRFLGGLGMGGAWAAGATLVAESWPPNHRGKGGAIMQMGLPLGAMLAIAVVSGVAALADGLDHGAWRWIYACGAVPAVVLLIVIRKTPESPLWLARHTAGERQGGLTELLQGGTGRGLLTAFSFVFLMQYIYWAVFAWTPTFLMSVKHMKFASSLGFVLVQQSGTLAGFLVFSGLIDRIGRRPSFMLFLACGGLAFPGLIYGTGNVAIAAANLLIGFGVGGVFSGLGPYIAELIGATRSRGLGMAIAYNGGRIGGLIAPVLIGALATTDIGFQIGLLTTLLGFVLAFTIAWLGPETKGKPLQ